VRPKGSDGSAMPPSSRANRKTVTTLLDKGLVQYAIGARDAAIAYWQQALGEDPASARAHDYLRSVGAIPGATGAVSRTDEVPALPASDVDDFDADGPTVLELDGDSGESDSLVPPFTHAMAAFEDDGIDTADLEPEPMVPDVEILLRDARSDEEAGRHEGALRAAEEALKRDPEHYEAGRLAMALRERLSAQYLLELEPLERVPYLRATDASILELSLDPIGGFLISQIDGEITIEELLTILGTFDQFRVLSSLHFFLENGIIELR